MPRISIIMPVYNKRSYLERSLDSVLNQDFSDYELVAVDDGSTDDSLTILDAYRSRDERIRIIHTENHGVSHARNLGLENADGEYVVFLDADDELKRNYLSSLYEAIQKNDVDIVIQGITKISPDGSCKDIGSGLKDGIYQLSELLLPFATIQKNTGLFGYCFSKIYVSKLIKNIRFDECLDLAEDFDFNLKVYKRVKTMYIENQSSYHYYLDLEGSSTDVGDEDIDYAGQFIVNCRYRDFLKDAGSYNGNNTKIINDRILTNAYYMLFYSDKKSFKDRCKLFKDNMDDFSGLQIKNRFERSVLHLVFNENYQIAQNLIGAYKTIRVIKRKVLP